MVAELELWKNLRLVAGGVISSNSRFFSIVTLHSLSNHNMQSCRLCGWDFKNCTMQDICNHQSTPHIFTCIHCKLSFVSQHSLQIHLTKAHTTKLSCILCGFEVETYRRLRAHQSLSHSFLCTLCPRKFRRKRDLTSHLKQVMIFSDFCCNFIVIVFLHRVMLRI